MTVLEDILQHKAQEVAARRRQKSEQAVRAEAESLHKKTGASVFVQALQQRIAAHGVAVIAEIKRASPSAGLMRPDLDLVAVAQSYQNAGAAALSILTDEVFFQGSNDFLPVARDASNLPCLRKDFMIDRYQIFESKTLHADCVLLIVAVLDPKLLQDMYVTAQAIGLDVLVEVHDARELDVALALNPSLIGINNRDLHSFETCLSVSEALCANLPPEVLVVAESGVDSRDDVRRLQAAGIQAFLVGGVFMRAEDPGAMLHKLFAQL